MMDALLESTKGVSAILRQSAVALVLGIIAFEVGAQQPAEAPAADYLIGPGDSLQIFVFGQPELSVTVPVRPDGRVSTPLIEDLQAVGKTPTQLAREMEQILSEFIRTPKVNVIPKEFVGTFANQIRVLGQATQPQALPYRDKMTLLDVMIAVGGLTDFAAGNEATILRKADGDKQYSVRLKDLIKRGDISANVEMKPGDILIIPQSFF